MLATEHISEKNTRDLHSLPPDSIMKASSSGNRRIHLCRPRKDRNDCATFTPCADTKARRELVCPSWVPHIYRLATALFWPSSGKILVHTLWTRKNGEGHPDAAIRAQKISYCFGATASRGLQVVYWYCANKSAAALGCHEQANCYPSVELCLLRNGDLLEMLIVDGPSLLSVSRLLFVISFQLHTDQREISTRVGFP